MSKRRAIDTRIRASENFSRFTYRQRDLWHGLIVSVDDQGRMPGHPAFVRSTIWPYDDIALAEVSKDLEALEAAGNILWYEIDGCKYIQLVNWHKYQSNAEWLALSEYPAPQGWQDHARYHGAGNKINTLNWETRQDATLPPTIPPTLNDGSELPARDVNDDGNDEGEEEDDAEGEEEPAGDALFDAIRDAVQLRTGITDQPANAVKAITTMIQAGCTLEDVKGGLDWYLNEPNRVLRFWDSLVGPADTARLIRIQAANKPPGKNGSGKPLTPEEVTKKYTGGQFGDFVEH